MSQEACQNKVRQKYAFSPHSKELRLNISTLVGTSEATFEELC